LPDGVIAEIPLDPGVAPLGITVADGLVWVASHRASTLYGIDPATNQVSARIDIGQEQCGGLVFAFNLLWITPCGSVSTDAVVVDPVKGAVVGKFASYGYFMGFTPNAVWTEVPTGDGYQTVRIDPVTIQPEAPLPAGAAPGGDNYIWVNQRLYVTYSDEPRISRLDPTTGATLETIRLPDWPEGPDVGAYDDVIWLMGEDGPQLLKFDTTSETVTEYTLPGWAQTSGAHSVTPFGAVGSIWLRTSDSAISRIDPTSGQVTAVYPADPGGGNVVVAFGSLWVANFNTDTVWREQIDS
jgi:YVTN family beta-propeller protein